MSTNGEKSLHRRRRGRYRKVIRCHFGKCGIIEPIPGQNARASLGSENSTKDYLMGEERLVLSSVIQKKFLLIFLHKCHEAYTHYGKNCVFS